MALAADVEQVATTGTVARADAQNRRLAIVVAFIAGMLNFAIVVQGWFFLDDFRNLGQAKGGLHLLTPVGDVHLEPGQRLLYWLAAVPFRGSYAVAEGLVAALVGLGAYMLVRLLDELFGVRRSHLVLAFLVGTSYLLIATDQWFAATPSSIATVAVIGAMLGFVSWLRRRSRWAYAGGLLSSAVAIASLEEALALPIILFLIWWCFARDARSWTTLGRALAPFLAISLAFAAYVQLHHLPQSLAVPTALEWAKLLIVMVFHALLPSIIGTGLPNGAPGRWGWTSIAMVTAGLVLVVVYLTGKRRMNPRAPLFFVIATFACTAPVALTRVTSGVSAPGNTPRYLTFLPLILAVTAAGAVTPARTPPATAARRRWVGVSLLVLLGLYVANLNASFATVAFGRENGVAASAMSSNISAGIAALGPGSSSLLDSALPPPIWYPGTDGTGELSTLLPFWSSTDRALGEGPRIAGIDSGGVVRWATFHPGRSTGTPAYVRIDVVASAATTLTVTVHGVDPTQPETPWQLSVAPGRDSFTLPAWSNVVSSVQVMHGAAVADSVEVGSISLGTPVTGNEPAGGAPALVSGGAARA